MTLSCKRIISVAILVALVCCFIPAPIQVAAAGTGYTSADDVQYYTTGNYIANWGYRGEDCLFLSTYASNFYSSSNSFDVLSQLEGGSNANDAHYSDLYEALQKLMADAHNYETSYEATKNLYKYTDCQENDTSKISSFYSGTIMNSSWGSGWNREHTWPNSKGLGGMDENDIMMLRPTSTSENSSRGNKSYGEASGYYDPNNQTAPASVRGDVARITLYVYVRWGNTNIWGHYKENGTWKGNFESLEILLKWMEEDPVDTWEMGRNDAVQSITGTRNVFVDYPEYAWLLFGQDVPEGITTPSDNDGVSANPGSNTGSGDSTGGSTGSNTDTSYTQLSSLNDGDQVLIVNPAYNMALSTAKTGYYNVGIDISGGFSGVADSDIYTAKKNSDGSWSFTAPGGKKLALGDRYNSINESGSNDKWELTSAGDELFYLKNSTRDVYLDWYANMYNWSTYKPDSLDDCYALAFYVKSSADSTTDDNPGTTQPDDVPDVTEPDDIPDVTEPDTTTQPTQSTQPQQTTPSQPASLSTNPVSAIPTDGAQNSLDSTTLIIIIAVAVVVIGGGITAVVLIKRKKSN